VSFRQSSVKRSIFDSGVSRNPRFVPQSRGPRSRGPYVTTTGAVLKRQRPRPPLTSLDWFFWITLRRVWPRWSDVVVLAKPEKVIGWHRAGFRHYWRWRSWPRDGRPKIDAEIRNLIRTMAVDNVGWGAPRIHCEVLKLGFEIFDRTVARYIRRLRRQGDPGQRWLTFLAIIVRRLPRWISFPFRQ